MAEPERTIATEAELTGSRVTLRVERVRLEDGTEAVRDVVHHPDSVAIVPVDGAGNVVMVRQYRKAAGRALLELPAGVIDGDEPPPAAARRELREETGLDATDLTELGAFFASPGSMTECIHSFLAWGLYDHPLPADADERISVERVPFRDAVALARSGGIGDAKTLAALLLAEPRMAGTA